MRELMRHAQGAGGEIILDRQRGHDLTVLRSGEGITFQSADIDEQSDVDGALRPKQLGDFAEGHVWIGGDAGRAAANAIEHTGVFGPGVVQDFARHLLAFRRRRHSREVVIFFP